MGEIKREVRQLKEGVPYTPGPDEYVITDEHSISDIVRFAASFSDMEEVLAIAQMELGKCSCSPDLNEDCSSKDCIGGTNITH